MRDIQHHLARTLGTDLSHDTTTKITDSVLEEVNAWQARPLEARRRPVLREAFTRRQALGRARRKQGSRGSCCHVSLSF